MDVLVLGHSFVRRLGEFCDKEDSYGNLKLYPHRFNIHFLGFGGAHIANLRAAIPNVWEMEPAIVVLQIGGNDISFTNQNATLIGQSILDFAKVLLQTPTVKQVVICKLHYRYQVPGQRRMPLQYNLCVDQINTHLGDLTRDIAQITIQPHRGMFQNWQSLRAPDGIHLNALGMNKYFTSIRGSIIDAHNILTAPLAVSRR